MDPKGIPIWLKHCKKYCLCLLADNRKRIKKKWCSRRRRSLSWPSYNLQAPTHEVNYLFPHKWSENKNTVYVFVWVCLLREKKKEESNTFKSMCLVQNALYYLYLFSCWQTRKITCQRIGRFNQVFTVNVELGDGITSKRSSVTCD